MKFRGKIMGIGESPGIGRILLIRPYDRIDDDGTTSPTTTDGMESRLIDAGLVGEKVRITIEEE